MDSTSQGIPAEKELDANKREMIDCDGPAIDLFWMQI